MYGHRFEKFRNRILWLLKKILEYTVWCALMVMIMGSISITNAQEQIGTEEDALEELQRLLEEDVVITASKTREVIAEAPAIMTVITAQQIRDMGARTLTDVLKTVPGIEVFIEEYGYHDIVIRGGRTKGERVKFLINGHSVNPPRKRQPAVFFDDLTVENIRRVEIIRGPGSALYGTNAFRGVF